MRKKQTTTRAACAAMLIVAIAMLGGAASASAKLTGEFTKFAQCPYTNTEVRRCLYSTTTGGTVVLGSKKVPIVNPVPLQGGYGPVGEDEFATKFFAAKNGITLAKVPQPVPGGLAGLVNCKEISNFLLRVSCEVTFENGLTGLNSVLELAKPASAIRISENHLAEEFDIALEMPIKIRLENPFLGENCYVGSESTPITWKLTTGTTAPPAPNTPIKGTAGALELFEEGSVLKLKQAELVDNSWSAPAANGCGGIFSFILDPIVNASAGLPAKAGVNTAILKNDIYESPRVAVNLNNVDNP
jgi:hypothetical protein